MALKLLPPKSNNDKLLPYHICLQAALHIDFFFNPSYDTQKSLEYRKKAERSIDGSRALAAAEQYKPKHAQSPL